MPRRVSCITFATANCSARGEGGTPLAFPTVFTTRSSLLHPGPASRKHLGPSAAVAGDRCFRASWKGAIRRNLRSREKATFVAQGVMSGKIFELAKPANVSLWKELSGYFARPEVKAKLAQEIGRRDASRNGAHFSWPIWSANSSRFGFSKNSFSKSAAETWSKACRR